MSTKEAQDRANRNYVERQKAAGLTKATVWIPRDKIAALQRFAAELRGEPTETQA